ncbi:UV-damaged DNA binding protein1 [Heterostelium album PN500]|uniref:DNA damage-binding protein 1 n=1 Tax=Heterostelium pallidum (strain ATCC 26659 / Pp 5 / PN500) TaxID=670386 RepID=D3B8I4_HETP5|nr:UV-damaged DNA binding protein1 [Heterostelium album PN500]EFA82352.1 UV-damaged DNA binding protein1 [Heterostelium album PN500]|eukprot:XP_020434469.1 UV-damaged DNA binding protein1 [Heterostelium album PN500]
MYNFVSTVQKPTAVYHSVTGCFTSPNERNLIISKGTKLEIFTLTPEGLSPVLDVNIYGRISDMRILTATGDKQDRLFILTEKYKYCILAFNSESRELVTIATGDAEGTIGRPAEAGQIGIVDPECRMIGMHLYEGLFRVVPLEHGQPVRESFSMRIEQLQIVDMVFLKQCAKPTLALLFKDTRDARHIVTYSIDVVTKELIEGASQDSVEENSTMLVPLDNGAMLIVGEMAITYMNLKGNSQPVTISIDHTHIVAYEQIDRDRFLLADDCGSFGVVYVGSSSGDSQLIRLNSHIDPNTGSYISVIDQFTNLGPITDFCVVDVEKQGQGQLVTCSGTFQDGSLRIIRNGIGIAEQASIELPGIRGLWSLSNNSNPSSLHRHLIVSFINSTKVLTFSGEEIEETEIAGFDSNATTLYCGNTTENNHFIQIATSGIYLVDSSSLMRLDQYTPEKGSINLASCNGSQILISQGSNLTYLEISDSKLIIKKEAQLQYEISCLDISLLDGFTSSPVCAVGLWTDISVRILQLPNLNEVCKETLGGEILPRSILFITFEGTNYLLCSLGDGHLFNFTFDVVENLLQERKKLSLGTTPILLNSTNVFASSDRPTVIYSNNKKLLYSAINMKVVSHVCSFNSEAFRDSIAIATESSLVIGTIDEIQKLHIRNVPLGEMARRITYVEEYHSYAVITIQRNDGNNNNNDNDNFNNNNNNGVPLTNYVKLLNEQTFETTSKYALKSFEFGWSIVTCRFKNDDALYVVVGTAFHNEVESQQSKGRILVFRIEDNRLILLDEVALPACVYCLLPFNGRLLAGINKRVQAFNWGVDTNKLTKAESYSGHTLSHSMVSRGHFVLVADLMKSMTLLVEDQQGAIKELARNPLPIWLSRIEMIDDETFIGGDNSYNLIVVQKNAEASSEIDNELLDTVGQFHLGETINKFKHGSLVTSPDMDSPKLPTILFGTVSGAIGVIVSISKDDYEFFEKLQKGLNRVVHGVGGLPFENWRSFSTEHMTIPSKNFIDGDLIETFLDLRHDKMLEAIKDMNISIEDTYRRIESLMHHIR